MRQGLVKPGMDRQTAAAAAATSLQSCPTLCNPIDGSPPGSAIHGILQVRTLEWGAIAFSVETAVTLKSHTVTGGHPNPGTSLSLILGFKQYQSAL